jgi:LPXTG-motif cell wall-anchored protein
LRRVLLVAAFTVVLGLEAPPLVAAADGPIVDPVRLALTPVGQPGSFFDLTMRAGDTLRLEVDVANTGDAPVDSRTYAADVYTINNGGFGARLRNAPQSGTTGWVDFPAETRELPARASRRQAFTVTVPAGTGAGEYITSLILENDEPIRAVGDIAFDQVARQAVALVITVPGPRSPALAIGAASHRVVATTSVVAVAVENPGNIRLKPTVTFALSDGSGAEVSRAVQPMDSFYARTTAFVEFPLAARLDPGQYTVELRLDDGVTGARAYERAIPFVVEGLPEPPAEAGTTSGLIGVLQGLGGEQIAVPSWAVIVGVSLLLGGLFVLVIRRRRNALSALRR